MSDDSAFYEAMDKLGRYVTEDQINKVYEDARRAQQEAENAPVTEEKSDGDSSD